MRETYTSYSLNFEDVILHRLFPKRKDGFYVDVGAGHPKLENDLFALYERGWRGINVEPNDGFFALYAQSRPRDRTLCMVLSDAPGPPLTYHQVDGSGLSTCDAAQAARYREEGRPVVTRAVPVATLASILEEEGVERIDILKVDVEGFEERVLSGNDWDRFRPSVVLIEATYPESPERRPTNIGGFMEQRGYRHVLFDGLNDFYLEHDFPEPPGLRLPPNVFDGFVPHQAADTRAQVASLQEHFDRARDYAADLRAALDAKEAALADAAAQAADHEALGKAHDALVLAHRALVQELRGRENENRRLRTATTTMRAEIGVLNRLLEPMHAANERLHASQARLDATHRAHAEETRTLREALHGLELRLHLVYASRSWALTKPWRFAGRVLRRLRSR